jgi:hypothetical protein
MFVGNWGFRMIISQSTYPMTILEQILGVSGYQRLAAPHERGARVS